MKYSNAAVQQNDARLVSRTLLKLATPRIIMRAVVIIVTIILWLWVAARILEFGAVQDYAFLTKFNAQLVSFLQSINPYLWWAVVLLGTLIVYFFLSAWYSGSVQRAAYKTVPADTAAELIRNLSPEGRDVLGWVWRDRTEPINIGNLKTTKDELDNNRVSKLAQIREQERLLGPAPVVAADDRLASQRLVADERRIAEDRLAAENRLGDAERPVTDAQRPVTDARRAADDRVAATIAAAPPVQVQRPEKTQAAADSAVPPVTKQNIPPAPTTAEAPASAVAEPAVRNDAASSAPADAAGHGRHEPVIPAEGTPDRATVSTSEQTEPTIGRPDDTHLRPPRDDVKHTIT